MKEDVFSFEDFLNKPKNILKENKVEEPNLPIEEIEEKEEVVGFAKSDEEDSYSDEEEITENMEEDKYYKIYKDRSEDFSCEISIEGADQSDTQARLVVESEDWTLMFKGEIKNGKCVIPIRKLSILPEGQIGNIRLEVVAEGNLFVPWEDKFQVKVSKKVTVKVNEQKETRKPEKKVGVKVNVKK